MAPLALRRRSSPSIATLLGGAPLATVLAYQAWDAARSHRATAEAALRDYASFAAWEFSIAAKEELYQTLVSIFGPVAHQKPLPHGAHPAPPSILASSLAQRVLCPDQTPYFFRLDLPTKALVVHGRAPSPAIERWIRDTILVDLAQYRRDWSYSTVTANIAGSPCSIAYQVKWTSDWKPAAAYGFQLCLSSMAEPSFAKTMKHAKLLPPSLMKGVPPSLMKGVSNDKMMSVILRDEAGHELWRTRQQYPPHYV